MARVTDSLLTEDHRTNRDTFLGHTILNIPPSETHDIWVPLSREEEIIYKYAFNTTLTPFIGAMEANDCQGS